MICTECEKEFIPTHHRNKKYCSFSCAKKGKYKLSQKCNNKEYDRWFHVFYNYKITKEQYIEIFKEQNGLCAICKEPETQMHKGNVTNLSIDHNHITGRVRGLLCRKCNVLLSKAEDKIEILERAIQYLQGDE